MSDHFSQPLFYFLYPKTYTVKESVKSSRIHVINTEQIDLTDKIHQKQYLHHETPKYFSLYFFQNYLICINLNLIN